jgi:AhpD family alkylhydroperoxidase
LAAVPIRRDTPCAALIPAKARVERAMLARRWDHNAGKLRRTRMSKNFVQIANDVVTGAGLLRQGAPDTMAAFAALSKAATASNALDTKSKELMAVAIGIAVRCEGCIAYHTKMAHRHGATRQELLETVALAVYMGGGPSSVYGADAVRAYDQFSGHQEGPRS